MTKENCKICNKHRSELISTPYSVPPEPYTIDLKKWDIICIDCHKNSIKQQITDFQESEPDTEHESDVICPICGYKDFETGEFSEMYEDGNHNMQCENCENEFELVTEISFTYSTFKIDKEL